MIYCDKCGVANENSSAVCYSCGSRIQPQRPVTAQQQATPQTQGLYTPPPPQLGPYVNPAYPVNNIGFKCPFCQSPYPPLFRSKTSTSGWIVVLILLLVCFPLFWLGFLMTETSSYCRSCGMKLS